MTEAGQLHCTIVTPVLDIYKTTACSHLPEISFRIRAYSILFQNMFSIPLFPTMEYLYTHSFFTQPPSRSKSRTSSHTANTDASPESLTVGASGLYDKDDGRNDTGCTNEEQDPCELDFIDDYFDVGYKRYKQPECDEDKSKP